MENFDFLKKVLGTYQVCRDVVIFYRSTQISMIILINFYNGKNACLHGYTIKQLPFSVYKEKYKWFYPRILSRIKLVLAFCGLLPLKEGNFLVLKYSLGYLSDSCRCFSCISKLNCKTFYNDGKNASGNR